MLAFSDLTPFDLNLLKSNAIHILISTRVNDRYEALADAVISCIKAKGYNILDEPKNQLKILVAHVTPTWSESKDRSADHVIALMFEYFKDKLEKDNNRLPTWSTPNAAWYTHYDNRKKPWQI